MIEMEDFDNPAFDPEEVEEIDGDDYTIIDVDSPPAGRTTTDPSGPSTQMSLQQKLLQSAVNDYYNVLAEWGEIPSLGRDKQNLSWLKDGYD